jgi:transcriptional regulator with XRE-family HTH domain
MDFPSYSLADEIRIARLSRRLTQWDLADLLSMELAIKITQQRISDWENGLGEPSDRVVKAIFKICQYRY